MTRTLAEWRTYYAAGGTVRQMVAELRAAHAKLDDPAIFIGGLNPHLDDIADRLDALVADRRGSLFGIPFAIKDNIDAEGLPTSAACPEFTYHAQSDAASVAALVAVGAVPVGKANLDQFATGLVGTRSPFGTPRNPFDDRAIPGGSSSGSAVAVAAGIVAFSLGTDTAGSGRVPAALNQIVGLKPSRGMISTEGVVPACASFDCVSVFAANVADASEVAEVMGGAGSGVGDRQAAAWPLVRPDRARVGVLPNEELDSLAAPIRASYERCLETLSEAGATVVTVDPAPLFEAGRMLYDEAFVAERFAGVGGFLSAHPQAGLEPVRSIILEAEKFTAAEYHQAQAQLERLRRIVSDWWMTVDVLVMPTVSVAPTPSEVAASPVELNKTMGRYTTFTNLLDLAVVTVPDRKSPGAGGGLSLQGPAGSDARLAALAALVTGEQISISAPGCTDLVVAGAHLEGFALNHQLRQRRAQFVRTAQTLATYRFWALPDGLRPALSRVEADGESIEVEVWSLPDSEFGGFLAGIAAPLGLGQVLLDDGTSVVGFHL